MKAPEMILPMNAQLVNQPNELLSYLTNARSTYEAKLRVPQPPAELERANKMLAAINSAIAIVNKTKMTTLTQKN